MGESSRKWGEQLKFLFKSVKTAKIAADRSTQSLVCVSCDSLKENWPFCDQLWFSIKSCLSWLMWVAEGGSVPPVIGFRPWLLKQSDMLPTAWCLLLLIMSGHFQTGCPTVDEMTSSDPWEEFRCSNRGFVPRKTLNISSAGSFQRANRYFSATYAGITSVSLCVIQAPASSVHSSDVH